MRNAKPMELKSFEVTNQVSCFEVWIKGLYLELDEFFVSHVIQQEPNAFCYFSFCRPRPQPTFSKL